MIPPPMPPALDSALAAFEDWCARHPGPVSHSLAFTGRGASRSLHGACHAVVVLAQHGDEWGTLPATVEALPLLRGQVEALPEGARVTVLLGNPAAVRIDDRWVEEDLNRCYPTPGSRPVRDSVERRRAGEIAAVARGADLVVDLHQTSQPTRQPFYVFPWHEPSVALARSLAVTDLLLTRDPGPIDDAGLCIDDHCHAMGVPTVAIEVGRKGENEMTRDCVSRVLQAVVAQVRHAWHARPAGEAIPAGPLRLLQVTRRFGFGSRGDAVPDALVNLCPVREGDPLVVGAEPVLAPAEGLVVFMQRPPRGPDGGIAGAIPRTAICLAEPYVPAARRKG